MNQHANRENIIEKLTQGQEKTQGHIIYDIFKAIFRGTSWIIQIPKQEDEESAKETKEIQKKQIDRERETIRYDQKKQAQLQSKHFPTKARECESRKEINDK